MNEICKKQKVESIQILRFISFFSIILEHCGILDFGVWGVSIFIIISGFCLEYKYESSDFHTSFVNNLRFSICRIKKLYPLHIVTMALSLLLQFNSNMAYDIRLIKESVVKIVYNVFLIQSLFPIKTIYFSLNAVSWYLSLSFFLYFLFPYIHKVVKSDRTNIYIMFIFTAQVLTSLFACFVLSRFQIDNVASYIKWLTYICPFYRMGDFAVGVCLAKQLLKSDTISTNDKRSNIYIYGLAYFLYLLV